MNIYFLLFISFRFSGFALYLLFCDVFLLAQKSSEEKLETALKSKSFFKEQLARAVREINRIKDEHQHHVQMQIKHKQEELRDMR